MSDLTVLVPEFVVTKSLPENSLIIGSKIESNRKRKAGENNRGGKYSGGGNTQYYAVAKQWALVHGHINVVVAPARVPLGTLICCTKCK